MSTDRELLELAAKAAGIVPQWRDQTLSTYRPGVCDPIGWNPLTDDGDALRLAVALRICVEFFGVYKQPGNSGVCCTAILHGQPVIKTDYAKQSETIDVATRRAIVRVAAHIGENMP